MAWIESHQQLREHPKVYHLAELLKVSKAATLGHLHLLWWWCVDYCPGGELKANDGLVARAGEWAGDAKEFVSALIEAGFIDRGDGVLTVHDWHEYAGKLIDAREKDRQRKQIARNANKNDVVSDGHPPDIPRMSGVPNSTQPNPTKLQRTNSARPRSIEEVKFAARAAGCPEAEAERFWHHFEASGWIDKNGHKIANWRSKLATWTADWRSKTEEKKHGSNRNTGGQSTDRNAGTFNAGKASQYRDVGKVG